MTSTLLTPEKWSLDRYHQMIGEGRLEDCRVEMVEGDFVEMAPVEPLHDDVREELTSYLRSMLGDRARVREATAVTLPNQSEPIPDIAVVRPQRYRDRHPQVEDIYLLIEIANSRPARDTEVKRLIYARAGITDYWVFDLEKDELRVFRDVAGSGDGADYQTDITWQDDAISIQAFPEVVLSAVKMMQLIA
mgnify:CR=1 FL=1